MDSEGNIHRNVTEEEIKEKGMTELTEEEAAELEKIPVDRRQQMLQQMREARAKRQELQRHHEHTMRMAADKRAADRKRKKKFTKSWKKRGR